MTDNMKSQFEIVENEEDNLRIGALRIAQYLHQNSQFRQQRSAVRLVSPEQPQELEQREAKNDQC